MIFSFCKFYNTHGGIETVSKNMNNLLLNNNFSLTIIYFGSKNKTIKKKNITYIESKINFTFFSQPISFNYLYNAFKIKYKNNDIIYNHQPNLLSTLIIIFLSSNLTIITHWHSDIINKNIFTLIANFFNFILLKKSSYIICHSKIYVVNSNILKYFKKKIKIFPNFIENNNYKKKISYKNKIICNIIFIGRLVKYKGIFFLIDALKYLPKNFKLIIIGNGPLYANLTNIINKYKFSEKIKIYKKASDIKKNNFLEKSDILCLPSISKQEAFGVVLLEAMMLGKPCVITKIKGTAMAKVVKHNISGIAVPARNSLAIAKAILKISKNYKFYSRNSFKRFNKYFQRKIIEKKILTLFKNLK